MPALRFHSVNKFFLFILFGSWSSIISAQEHSDSTYSFFFKFGKSDLPKDSILVFQKFYAQFESCVSCTFELKGYTDSIGRESDNEKLAQKRNLSVKKLLTEAHQQTLREEVFGEAFSINAINQALFRKVELIVHNNISSSKITPDKRDPFAGIDTTNMTIKEKRNIEFNQRNVAIRLQILFALNTVILLQESNDDMEFLAEYMLNDPKVNASLTGHVCCNNDLPLSKSRAYQVYVFLVKKGISKHRLSAKGVGNTRPVMPETDTYAEQMNRRVEVVFWEIPE